MKFGRRDLKTINGALMRAVDWEADLAEANQHIPVERRKCLRAVERFRKLRVRILAVLRGSPEAVK